jgi:GNAT superfamily N-acetyltransferase
MNEVMVRVAGPEELRRIRETYREWGYGGGAEPSDVVLLAERDGLLIGIVRRTTEFGVVMLRGMQVAPDAQRQGFGGKLLDAFLDELEGEECYCVPYAHLVPFYSRIGFEVWPLERGPSFLRDRIAEYRAKGLDVTLMRRPAA